MKALIVVSCLDATLSSNFELSAQVMRVQQSYHVAVSISNSAERNDTRVPLVARVSPGTGYGLLLTEGGPSLTAGVRGNTMILVNRDGLLERTFTNLGEPFVVEPHAAPGGDEANIGLSPSGSFVSLAGPIVLIPNQSQAIVALNATESYWRNHCDVDLSIEVPVGDDQKVTVPAMMGLNYLNEDYTVNSTVSWPVPVTFQITTVSSNSLIMMPGRFVRMIDDVLNRLGSVRSAARETAFSPCNLDILNGLPDILLTWESIGTIIIPAEEYMSYDASSNSCTYRIRESSNNPAFFDFTQFRGTNVRIKRGTVEFCDPL